MMMKKMMFLTLLSCCACLATTTTVDISVSADADIRESTPDTAYGIRTDNVASTVSGGSAKIYMRFHLPADFGTATSANLKLVRTRVASATANLYYNLYGLNDDVGGQDWGETTSYVTDPATVQDGLTWNNAPANGSGNSFTSDATELVSLVMLPSGNNGGVVGSVHEFSSQELADFINTDTDGVITLMLNRHNTTSAWESFATKENTTYDEPILELTYEPGTAKTAELLPVADTDVRQDAADYAKSDRDTAIAQNTSDNKTKKIYIKYQLPSDFDYATNVDFKIVPVANYNTLWNWQYNIFGLKDDAVGNDWQELSPGEIPGQPYTAGLTWNNAPGNNPADGSMTSDATDKLTDFYVYSQLNEDVTANSTQDFVDFINTDTDGTVTIIITRTNISGGQDHFATKEHASQQAPRLVLTYEPLPSITANMSAIADTDIRQIVPDYAKSDREGIWVSSVTDNSMKGYMRFQLPNDIANILSATLTFTRHVAGVWSPTYDIYGLNDDAVGNDWQELSPGDIPGMDYTYGLTWNNAPGNDTSSTNSFDAVSTELVGSFQVVGTNAGGSAGDSYSITGIDLTDFLNTDTDGAVTFMIARNAGESTSVDVFGAKETGKPAVLTISYLPVCGVRLPGDINHDCNVDYLDFAILADDWLKDDPNFFTSPNSDIYPDDEIDIYDLKMLGENWLSCTFEDNPDCDQYWQGQYLASKRYNSWRQSFDTFPLAAWAYFARYDGSVEEYQTYYDAGLTMVQTTPEQYQNAVDAGLYTIMGTWDGLYSDLAKLDIFTKTPTATESNLRGLYLRDDIRDFQIPMLVDANYKILLQDVRGAVPMATTLPPWGSLSGSGGSSPYEDWLEYFNEYVDTVNPALLCNAYYVLMSDKNEREGIYDNLELMRTTANDKGIGFTAFAIVNEHTGYRAPSESDLNWNVWANLAYGAKGIWYYNWRIEPIGGFNEGIVTHLDGEPTAVYSLVQDINAEVQSMGQLLMSFESTGVYHADIADPNNTTIILYEDGDIDAIATFSGEQFILGEFANVDDSADTSDYLMLVNKRHAADTSSSALAASCSFTVSVQVSAVEHFDTDASQWQQLNPSGGLYTLNIGGGKSVLLKFSY